MISKKQFATIDELQQIQLLATRCDKDVGLHSPDGQIMVDAKSFIGLFSLDFSQPILVVSESESFHNSIQNIGKNV